MAPHTFGTFLGVIWIRLRFEQIVNHAPWLPGCPAILLQAAIHECDKHLQHPGVQLEHVKTHAKLPEQS